MDEKTKTNKELIDEFSEALNLDLNNVNNADTLIHVLTYFKENGYDGTIEWLHSCNELASEFKSHCKMVLEKNKELMSELGI